MASERRRLVSSILASTSETLKKLRASVVINGEEGAVLESPADVVVAEGIRDCVNCLKSCRLRRESERRKGVEEDDDDEEEDSWDVSEDNDLTRFLISCLCLTVVAETEGIPSPESLSDERDFTMLKKGLSLEGKLKDLVGEGL